MKTKVQEHIDELIVKARAAQAILAGYNQEQVDRIVHDIGKASYDAAEDLCKVAIEETKKGRLESKIAKHQKTVLCSWYVCKGAISVGVIEDNPVTQVALIGKPAGVVGCIVPSTNPTATPSGNAMHAIKARNAIIVTAHPGAKRSTAGAVELMRRTLREIGEPEDLIQIVDPELTDITAGQYLMSNVDLSIATGGSIMVTAAYSSGKPALGVGQGNVQDFVAEDWEDYEALADMLITNRTYDNGMPCTCDQHVHVPADKADLLIEELKKRKAYHVTDEAEIEAIRNVMFDSNRAHSRELVGVPAKVIAEKAGIDVPEDTSILLIETHKHAYDELLAKEILAPILRVRRYTDFKEAVQVGKENYLMEGAGHSSAVFTFDDEKIAYAAEEIPTCRMMVNQLAVAGGGGPFNNGLPHTISLGCGYWGGNSISENLTYKHLMNYTRVSRIIPDAHIPTPEEIWG